MEGELQRKKVLIVDDDKFLLDMYTTKFTEKNFEVTQAFGSIDALDKLKQGAVFDMILLDAVMPSMDGFELLKMIKTEGLAPTAKVVMLSNLGQAVDIEKGRALGADGYVVKASAVPSEVVEKALIVLDGGELFAEAD